MVIHNRNDRSRVRGYFFYKKNNNRRACENFKQIETNKTEQIVTLLQVILKMFVFDSVVKRSVQSHRKSCGSRWIFFASQGIVPVLLTNSIQLHVKGLCSSPCSIIDEYGDKHFCFFFVFQISFILLWQTKKNVTTSVIFLFHICHTGFIKQIVPYKCYSTYCKWSN